MSLPSHLLFQVVQAIIRREKADRIVVRLVVLFEDVPAYGVCFGVQVALETGMAITKGNVGRMQVAEALRTGVTKRIAETGVAGIRERGSHEFVRPADVVSIAEQRRLRRRTYVGRPDRVNGAGGFITSDIARVVVIAGVRIHKPVGRTFEDRALLYLLNGSSHPQQAGFDMFDRVGLAPVLPCSEIPGQIPPNPIHAPGVIGQGITIFVDRAVRLGGEGHLPQVVEAEAPLSLLPGRTEGRQQYADEQGGRRDDNEHFHQA